MPLLLTMPDLRSLKLALDRISTSPVSTPTARSENDSPARNSGSGVSRTQRSASSLSHYSDTASTYIDLTTQRSQRLSHTLNHSLAYWPPEDYDPLSHVQEIDENETMEEEHKESTPDKGELTQHTATTTLPPLSPTRAGRLGGTRKELHGSVLSAVAGFTTAA